MNDSPGKPQDDLSDEWLEDDDLTLDPDDERSCEPDWERFDLENYDDEEMPDLYSLDEGADPVPVDRRWARSRTSD